METIFSKRKYAVSMLIWLGVIIVLTSIMVNPWAGKLFSTHYKYVDRYEYLLGYFIWSLCLGILFIAAGLVISRKSTKLLDKLSMTIIIFSMFILLDRFFLVIWGETRFKFDPLIHYRNRPYAVLKWRGHDIIRVQLNKYGFNNNDFPEKKPDGEFRALILGDSVTIGDGVSSSETFSSQLESLLDTQDKKYASHLVINTAVQGYSTFQEWQILKESIKFEPDFVALCFCMNDLTEPFRVNRTLGGTGFDYHNIIQKENPVIGYLYNETGYGRLIQKARERKLPFVDVKRLEESDVKKMAGHSPDDARNKKKWQFVLSDLGEIYKTAEEHRIQKVLVIFPFTFQLTSDEYDYPQKVLKQQAEQYGVDVIDFADIFKTIIQEEVNTECKKIGKVSGQDIQNLQEAIICRYFLDEDHFTPEGHKIVALKLFEYLRQKELNKAETPEP